MISTVDPDTRHGHKTAARGFDGYKAHVAVDPDAEIITATTVTPGNTGDAAVAEDLIADLAGDHAGDHAAGDHAAGDARRRWRRCGQHRGAPRGAHGVRRRPRHRGVPLTTCASPGSRRGATQAPNAPGGRFGKDRFGIDLTAGTVDCPGGVTAVIRPAADGGGWPTSARPAPAVPLRAQCTTAAGGRTITVGPYEATLAAARAGKPIRTGSPTTARPAPRSNARSDT